MQKTEHDFLTKWSMQKLDDLSLYGYNLDIRATQKKKCKNKVEMRT